MGHIQVLPLRALASADRNQRIVVLTFDDGYRNFYEHALLILMAHGLTATVFVCPDLLGKRAEWLSVHGLLPSPLMDARQLREIASLGIEDEHPSTYRFGMLPWTESPQW